jgi:hypothetical protein
MIRIIVCLDGVYNMHSIFASAQHIAIWWWYISHIVYVHLCYIYMLKHIYIYIFTAAVYSYSYSARIMIMSIKKHLLSSLRINKHTIIYYIFICIILNFLDWKTIIRIYKCFGIDDLRVHYQSIIACIWSKFELS